MRIFDPNFKKNVPHYILQCLLAVAIIFIILLLTEAISNMVVIASLAASTFIATTMPHSKLAHPRYFIGGYVIGTLCGLVMYYLNEYLVSAEITVLGHSPHILTCSIAVGLSFFIMTMTDFEHPPAAALAMGLVVETGVLVMALIAVVSIIIISAIKTLLSKWMINLL